MRKLENEAKPILTNILNNENFELCPSGQKTLAQWITLKAIIGEYGEPDTCVTPVVERNLFRTQLKIPDFFAIYIGKHSENADTAWLKTSQTVARSCKGPNPPLRANA